MKMMCAMVCNLKLIVQKGINGENLIGIAIYDGGIKRNENFSFQFFLSLTHSLSLFFENIKL